MDCGTYNGILESGPSYEHFTQNPGSKEKSGQTNHGLIQSGTRSKSKDALSCSAWSAEPNLNAMPQTRYKLPNM